MTARVTGSDLIEREKGGSYAIGGPRLIRPATEAFDVPGAAATNAGLALIEERVANAADTSQDDYLQLECDQEYRVGERAAGGFDCAA